MCPQKKVGATYCSFIEFLLAEYHFKMSTYCQSVQTAVNQLLVTFFFFFFLKWRKGVHITGQRSLISDILCPIYVFTTVRMNDTSCHRLYRTEVKHAGCKRCHPSESIPTYAPLGQLTAGLSCQSRENRRASYSNA